MHESPVQYEHSATPLLSNSISILDSLDDLVCLLYPSLKTFYSLIQIAVLLLVSLRVKRFSSPDTPATASCKEKLVVALYD